MSVKTQLLVDVLDDKAVKSFIAKMLDRSQYKSFSISVEERNTMLAILNEKPDIIQAPKKIEHHASKRRPTIDDYDRNRKRARADSE